MVTSDELRAQVESRWAALGQPSWPPPRDPMDSPADEEYSRVTDPGRYRIVHERARLWAQVLGELPGVGVEQLGPGEIPVVAGDRPLHALTYERGTRLTSARPGTLPLLLLERGVPRPEDLQPDVDAMAVLHVCVARPEVGLTAQPDCGCDACDTGSEDILATIDEHVLIAVGGPLAVLRGRGWEATWHPDGGSSGGRGRGPDHTKVVDLCRRLAAGESPRLPRGTEAIVGRSWLA